MRVVWPVLSALLVIQWLLGMIVGHVEGWSIGDASYFTFVTGLTVGYGDLVPRQAVSRILAVLIGFIGAGPGAGHLLLEIARVQQPSQQPHAVLPRDLPSCATAGL